MDFKRESKLEQCRGKIETETIDLQMVKWLKMQNFSSFQLAENFQVQVRLAVKMTWSNKLLVNDGSQCIQIDRGVMIVNDVSNCQMNGGSSVKNRREGGERQIAPQY